VVEPTWLESIDEAARLALRDAAKSLALELRKGVAPTHGNGARTLAQVDGSQAFTWVSRDMAACCPGLAWGLAAVRIGALAAPLMPGVDLDRLLPPSGTQYLEISDDMDGDLAGFGGRFARLLLKRIRAVGGNGTLVSITYNDRYLQTPMTVRLLTEAVRGVRDALGCDGAVSMNVVTNPLKENERQPFAPDHDWQYGKDRDDVLVGLLELAGFEPTLTNRNAGHGRVMTLQLSTGRKVQLVLDQGFGPWRAPKFARFDYGVDARTQLAKLAQFNTLLTARSAGYIVVTAGV
jgi:DEAD/DEAH box helicase domain-containing protein